MHVSPKDGLTKHARKAVAEKIAGKKLEDIGKKVFPASKNPKQSAHQALSRPSAKKAIQAELEKAGITPQLRAERLKEMYDATKFDSEPDHKSRLDAEKHVSDLLGDKAPEKYVSLNASGELGHILELMEQRAKEV